MVQPDLNHPNVDYNGARQKCDPFFDLSLPYPLDVCQHVDVRETTDTIG